jgi:hypothetical protein
MIAQFDRARSLHKIAPGTALKKRRHPALADMKTKWQRKER